jgi:hypothetical protein
VTAGIGRVALPIPALVSISARVCLQIIARS